MRHRGGWVAQESNLFAFRRRIYSPVLSPVEQATRSPSFRGVIAYPIRTDGKVSKRPPRRSDLGPLDPIEDWSPDISHSSQRKAEDVGFEPTCPFRRPFSKGLGLPMPKSSKRRARDSNSEPCYRTAVFKTAALPIRLTLHCRLSGCQALSLCPVRFLDPLIRFRAGYDEAPTSRSLRDVRYFHLVPSSFQGVTASFSLWP